MAGDLNRDWPGRADVFRSFGGELDQDIVDQLDRAHTPSERAGTPTHGALNREAVLDAIRECAAPGMELRHDGSEDPIAAAYVAGVETAYAAAKGALEACGQAGTGGALNREKARDVLNERWAGFADVNEGESQDQRATVRLTPKAVDLALNALGVCVVPDARLARIEALIEEPWVGSTPDGRAVRMGMRAILRGDQ